MRFPTPTPVFFGALAVLWILFAVPAYFIVAELTSITAAAYREAKLVTGRINGERQTRGWKTRKLDVSFPRTYGLSTCLVIATTEEVAALRSREIGVYVIPDTPVACATAGTLPQHAPRDRKGDVVATSALSLAAALSITVLAWWPRQRFGTRRH